MTSFVVAGSGWRAEMFWRSRAASSTHGYHAVSLMRGLLGAGCGPVSVRASRTTAPLVDPLTRDGWTGDDPPKPACSLKRTEKVAV